MGSFGPPAEQRGTWRREEAEEAYLVLVVVSEDVEEVLRDKTRNQVAKASIVSAYTETYFGSLVI